MALPKKKVSKSRRDKRRANWKVTAPQLVKCPQCHEAKLPHHACPKCGYYAGRKAVTDKEDKAKAKEKKKRARRKTKLLPGQQG